MKKIIKIILVLALLITVFSGCSSGSLPNPKNPVTLTMWHVYGSQTKSPLNELIDEFNRTVGTENGITINVVSVTSSSAIDKALSASSKGEPGAEKMPDLFTAYPRVAEIVGEENLLRWEEYFSEEELSGFREEFLSEGYFGDSLLMLPIAKSTEAFYLNETLFEVFSKETGIKTEDLRTFDGVFGAAESYYEWSGGQNFMQINDFYSYAFIGMKAMGSELIRSGRIRLDDEAFEAIWKPLAKAAIHGGICLEDGYAAARWKTAEVIANTGSSADVLYQPSEVVFSDNSSRSITAIALPYPVFSEDYSGAIYRGGGLFAVRSENEARNKAAYIFAKWLVQKENNLDFVTSAGYLPVTDDAFDSLFNDISVVENEKYHSVYNAIGEMAEEYSFHALPLYENSSEIQFDFEQNVKTVLKSAHIEYQKRTGSGEDPSSVLEELIVTSLDELKVLTSG